MKNLALPILLIASLLFGGFAITPAKTNPSVDATQVSGQQGIEWETYHDDEYGWSIKYPSDWTLRANERTVAFYGFQGTASVLISTREVPASLSLRQFALAAQEAWEKGWEEKDKDVVKVREWETDIDNVPVIEALYQLGESPNYLVGIMALMASIKDGIGYTFNWFTIVPIYNQITEIYFDPMIQSFSFNVLKKGAPGAN